MERLMPVPVPDLAQNLHETNSRLAHWLDTLTPDSRPLPPASPQQMASLFSELLRAGECLRALPPDRRPALQQELDDYRKHVERLRMLLPSIQQALLLEKARLEQERTRIRVAAEWARRSRQTL
jgi:ABC-type transporter Mla subunit MlaD